MKQTNIRIVNPEPQLLKTVRLLAKRNKRSIGKQAEYMLTEWLSKNK